MIFVVLVVLGVLSPLWLVPGYKHGKHVLGVRSFGLPYREYTKLSLASQQLLHEYYQVPAENRPYANIIYILTALDVQHGVEKVNKHFIKYKARANDWGGTTYSVIKNSFAWSPTRSNQCSHYAGGNMCVFRTYVDMHDAFDSIIDGLAQRDQAVLLSAHADGLSAARELTEKLREERTLVDQTTKELAND